MRQFSATTAETPGARINLRHAGSGPHLLLLHGFPQTLLMWREVAPLLAEDFTVVCADLRGYGESSCPRPEETAKALSEFFGHIFLPPGVN